MIINKLKRCKNGKVYELSCIPLLLFLTCIILDLQIFVSIGKLVLVNQYQQTRKGKRHENKQSTI